MPPYITDYEVFLKSKYLFFLFLNQIEVVFKFGETKFSIVIIFGTIRIICLIIVKFILIFVVFINIQKVYSRRQYNPLIKSHRINVFKETYITKFLNWIKLYSTHFCNILLLSCQNVVLLKPLILLFCIFINYCSFACCNNNRKAFNIHSILI
jgi:hypothetical protein